MPIFDGVVNVDDEDIHVVLRLEEETVRLSAEGIEIGEWPVAECSIDHVGQAVYTITAENESLRFVPSEPSRFASGLNGTTAWIPETPIAATEEETPVADEQTEAPLPKQVTMVVFYALVGVTGLFGLWALFSLIFG